MKNNLITYYLVSIYLIPHIKKDNGYYAPDYHNRENWTCIKEFDIPDWVYRNHNHFFQVLNAKLQYENPGHTVFKTIHPYRRDGKGNIINNEKYQLSAKKAQITKWENIIKNYEKEQGKKLFWEKESDPQYQKALKKLEEKKKQLIT